MQQNGDVAPQAIAVDVLQVEAGALVQRQVGPAADLHWAGDTRPYR